MAVLAITNGWIGQQSVWCPINLLAAGFFPRAETTASQITAFQPNILIVANVKRTKIMAVEDRAVWACPPSIRV